MKYELYLFILIIIIGILLIQIFNKKNRKNNYTKINKLNNIDDYNNKEKNKLEKNIEKGIKGEEYICYLINKNLSIYYKIIKNVYIFNDDKKTEIDIVLITCFGIFIIESKNYNGILYGTEDQFKWTQFFTHTKKYYINNPINQNNYHIKFISKKLNKDESAFKSYIVFNNQVDFHNIEYDKNKTTIVSYNKLISQLITDMHNSNIIFSHEEIDKIYIDLKYYCEHSR